MQDDFEPKTEPSESKEDRPYSVVAVEARPNAFGRFLNRAFDVLDEAADKVAETLNIRPPHSG